MNDICYLEIPVADLKRASAFYAQAFGWTLTPSGAEYAMFKTPGGKIGGGLQVSKSPIPPMGICLYIEVESIPAALEKVVASGGQQVAAKQLIPPDHGYLGLFKDTEGNTLGVYSEK